MYILDLIGYTLVLFFLYKGNIYIKLIIYTCFYLSTHKNQNTEAKARLMIYILEKIVGVLADYDTAIVIADVLAISTFLFNISLVVFLFSLRKIVM